MPRDIVTSNSWTDFSKQPAWSRVVSDNVSDARLRNNDAREHPFCPPRVITDQFSFVLLTASLFSLWNNFSYLVQSQFGRVSLEAMQARVGGSVTRSLSTRSTASVPHGVLRANPLLNPNSPIVSVDSKHIKFHIRRINASTGAILKVLLMSTSTSTSSPRPSSTNC